VLPLLRAAESYTKQMPQVEIVSAPSLLTKGKVYQKAQQLGMGK
jgi:IMP dehydrogenase